VLTYSLPRGRRPRQRRARCRNKGAYLWSGPVAAPGGSWLWRASHSYSRRRRKLRRRFPRSEDCPATEHDSGGQYASAGHRNARWPVGRESAGGPGSWKCSVSRRDRLLLRGAPELSHRKRQRRKPGSQVPGPDQGRSGPQHGNGRSESAADNAASRSAVGADAPQAANATPPAEADPAASNAANATSASAAPSLVSAAPQ
jgi:hypothetical protein